MIGNPLTRALAGTAVLAALAGASLWYQLFRRPLPKTSRPADAARAWTRPSRSCATGSASRTSRAHPARPVLRARPLPRPGPAVAARVLPPRDRRPPVRVRRPGRAPRRPPDAHARHAPRRRARGARDRRRAARRSWTHTRRASTPRSTRPPALPIEFQLMRIEPEPWTAVDLLALGQADGLRPLDQLGDGAAARRARARGRPRARRAARAAVPARQPGRDRARRRLRGRGRRHRGPDRGASRSRSAWACTRPARTTGSSRASAR